jgi:hypothetical protein
MEELNRQLPELKESVMKRVGSNEKAEQSEVQVESQLEIIKPLVVPIIRHSILPFFRSFLQFVPNFQVAMVRELENVIRTTDRLAERTNNMPNNPELVLY